MLERFTRPNALLHFDRTIVQRLSNKWPLDVHTNGSAAANTKGRRMNDLRALYWREIEINVLQIVTIIVIVTINYYNSFGNTKTTEFWCILYMQKMLLYSLVCCMYIIVYFLFNILN